MTDVPTSWTREALEAAGFEGFVPFTELRVTKPPKLPGIYVVLRPSTAPPSYLERSVAVITAPASIRCSVLSRYRPTGRSL
jgi:hypothetical protein